MPEAGIQQEEFLEVGMEGDSLVGTVSKKRKPGQEEMEFSSTDTGGQGSTATQ